MTVYATVTDVQARMSRTLTVDEQDLCDTLLQDAAVIIDAFAPNAGDDVKRVVSCRMVQRVLGDADVPAVPLGATQGSMSALGYTQSWTVGSGGGTGELYLAKIEKQMLGAGNAVGSYSPVQELAGGPAL